MTAKVSKSVGGNRAARQPSAPPDPLARFDDEGGAMQPVSPLPDASARPEPPDLDDDPRAAEANERHERKELARLKKLQARRKLH